MEKFQRIETKLEGVFLIKPLIFPDNRGFFFESYNKKEIAKIGITTDFVQDNQSCSAKGVIRGLHFQTDHGQAKLVQVLKGAIFDVIVDIRKKSTTYGRWIGVNLSDSDPQMVYISVGFAHGFLSLKDDTRVLYKTTDYYHPEFEGGIRWDDPTIGIEWPIDTYGITSPVVSEKDTALPFWDENKF
jgi:dTDP-4-dehydrorhamnose 3,5-epimerase